MTRLRSIAHAMKTRLEEIAELKGCVSTYRRADIESRVESAMAKTKGRAVIVRLLKGTNRLKSRRTAFYDGAFTVSLFTSPPLTAKDAKDADDLLAAITAKLHGWWPADVGSNTTMILHCDAVTYGDEPAFDVAVLTVTTLSK